VLRPLTTGFRPEATVCLLRVSNRALAGYGDEGPPSTKETPTVATFRIYRVRTERPYGAAHEHITHVDISNTSGYALPRSTVLADLRKPSGDRYYTLGGGARAEVIAARCPHCTFRDYITTEPDHTTENNLLQLPRF
jgi:hypothetical protein